MSVQYAIQAYSHVLSNDLRLVHWSEWVVFSMWQAQFEVISSEVSYLKSMNILVGHFMANLGANFDRDRELTMSRDDFNRLFSNARAVRDASIKLVSLS